MALTPEQAIAQYNAKVNELTSKLSQEGAASNWALYDPNRPNVVQGGTGETTQAGTKNAWTSTADELSKITGTSFDTIWRLGGQPGGLNTLTQKGGFGDIAGNYWGGQGGTSYDRIKNDIGAYGGADPSKQYTDAYGKLQQGNADYWKTHDTELSKLNERLKAAGINDTVADPFANIRTATQQTMAKATPTMADMVANSQAPGRTDQLAALSTSMQSPASTVSIASMVPTQGQNQILDLASMAKYQPSQYSRMADGSVVLKAGVTPIPGTTKPYQSSGTTQNSSATGGAMSGTDPSASTPPAKDPYSFLTDSGKSSDWQSTVQALRAEIAKNQEISPEEMAAKKKLDALLASKDLSINQIEAEPIVIAAKQGQEASIQNQILAQAQPLEAQLAQIQAQRQARLDKAKTALETELALNKPVQTPWGATYNNPSTGTSVGGGVFGKTETSATTAPFDPNSAVDQAAKSYMATGDIDAKLASIPQAAAIVKARADALSMQETGQPFNPASRKADITTSTSSLADLQKTYSSYTTAEQILNSDGKLLLDTMKKAGIVGDSPISNSVNNAVSRKVLTDKERIAVDNSIENLRGTYAQINAKGGSVTQENKTAALKAIPDNISVSAMARLLQQMQTEAKNNRMATQSTIDTLKKQVQGYSFGSSNAPAEGSVVTKLLNGKPTVFKMINGKFVAQ